MATSEVEKLHYYYSVGRRKESVVTAHLHTNGKGNITVNKIDYKSYFNNPTLIDLINEPFKILSKEGEFDISLQAKGGGVKGQVDASRLAIARCLIELNPEWKTTLKKAGLLTRDPRVKERKKPGLRGARKAPQYSKR